MITCTELCKRSETCTETLWTVNYWFSWTCISMSFFHHSWPLTSCLCMDIGKSVFKYKALLSYHYIPCLIFSKMMIDFNCFMISGWEQFSIGTPANEITIFIHYSWSHSDYFEYSCWAYDKDMNFCLAVCTVLIYCWVNIRWLLMRLHTKTFPDSLFISTFHPWCNYASSMGLDHIYRC